MKSEITQLCADSLRTFALNKFGIQLKSSHAHELVAAYFGYSSRAALLADTKYPISNLRQPGIIVLTPTALIEERRKELKGLPENLPDDLAEGVYLPLYGKELNLHQEWPIFKHLTSSLADGYLKSKSFFFDDHKIQRDGMKVEKKEDSIRFTVYREYVSARRMLAGTQGVIVVIDIFDLRRVAGHIGYAIDNHNATVEEIINSYQLDERRVAISQGI